MKDTDQIAASTGNWLWNQRNKLSPSEFISRIKAAIEKAQSEAYDAAMKFWRSRAAHGTSDVADVGEGFDYDSYRIGCGHGKTDGAAQASERQPWRKVEVNPSHFKIYEGDRYLNFWLHEESEADEVIANHNKAIRAAHASEQE